MKRTSRPDQFTLRRLMVKALLLCTGRVRLKNPPKPPFGSVIILAQEKLGDAILLTPLPRLLKASFPETIIHVVTLGKNRGVFEADPHIDRVIAVKPDLFTALRTIRLDCYDVLINTKDHPSFSFLLLTRIVRTRFRLGIFHRYHRGFFDHLITMDFHRHAVEKNCAFLAALGIPFDTDLCRPQLPPGPVSATTREFAAHLRSFSAPRIGINLSAGESDREWPLEKWREVLAQFPRATFTVFAMPDKTAEKCALETTFANCIPAPETPALYDAAEILKNLDLLITPDTSLIHVCSCLCIPVVALFRSHLNHMSHFSPYRIPHRMVVSPTMLVQDIPVAQVVSAIRELLASASPEEERNHGT